MYSIAAVKKLSGRHALVLIVSLLFLINITHSTAVTVIAETVNPGVLSGNDVQVGTSGASGGTSPYTYQWYSCGSDPTCASPSLISGATNKAYTLVSPPSGSYYFFEVVATDSKGNTGTSNPIGSYVIPTPTTGTPQLLLSQTTAAPGQLVNLVITYLPSCVYNCVSGSGSDTDTNTLYVQIAGPDQQILDPDYSTVYECATSGLETYSNCWLNAEPGPFGTLTVTCGANKVCIASNTIAIQVPNTQDWSWADISEPTVGASLNITAFTVSCVEDLDSGLYYEFPNSNTPAPLQGETTSSTGSNIGYLCPQGTYTSGLWLGPGGDGESGTPQKTGGWAWEELAHATLSVSSTSSLFSVSSLTATPITIFQGQSSTLSGVASGGTGSYTYQWYSCGLYGSCSSPTAISGATSNTYTFGAAPGTAAGAWFFYLSVKSGDTTENSPPGVVYVLPSLTLSVQGSTIGAANVLVGASANVSVSVTDLSTSINYASSGSVGCGTWNPGPPSDDHMCGGDPNDIYDNVYLTLDAGTGACPAAGSSALFSLPLCGPGSPSGSTSFYLNAGDTSCLVETAHEWAACPSGTGTCTLSTMYAGDPPFGQYQYCLYYSPTGAESDAVYISNQVFAYSGLAQDYGLGSVPITPANGPVGTTFTVGIEDASGYLNSQTGSTSDICNSGVSPGGSGSQDYCYLIFLGPTALEPGSGTSCNFIPPGSAIMPSYRCKIPIIGLGMNYVTCGLQTIAAYPETYNSEYDEIYQGSQDMDSPEFVQLLDSQYLPNGNYLLCGYDYMYFPDGEYYSPFFATTTFTCTNGYCGQGAAITNPPPSGGVNCGGMACVTTSGGYVGPFNGIMFNPLQLAVCGLFGALNVVFLLLALTLLALGAAMYMGANLLPGQSRGTVQGYAFGFIIVGIIGTVIAVVSFWVLSVAANMPVTSLLSFCPTNTPPT